ncbi:MAG: hypothetical protein SFU56_19315 [Capsulimonadales bacterium]|nr:hypothetical protein [Capsulimonadales bacterium]
MTRRFLLSLLLAMPFFAGCAPKEDLTQYTKPTAEHATPYPGMEGAKLNPKGVAGKPAK